MENIKSKCAARERASERYMSCNFKYFILQRLIWGKDIKSHEKKIILLTVSSPS